MINPARLPPLPRGKTPSSNSLLQIIKITSNQTTPVARFSSSHLPSHSTSLNDIFDQPSKQKQRPLSSKSGTSKRRETSASVEERSTVSGRRTKGNSSLCMPEVTAKSWILYEMREGRCLYGKRNFKKREIASLTKIMNLVTILEIVQLLKLNARIIKVRASQRACGMTGTSAELREGAVYSLQDLYYGMMLPSGNDAAMLIAEVGGCLLKQIKEGERKLQETQLLDKVGRDGGNGVGTFLRQMNRLARQIGMFNSNFANPHGLSNTSSHSTASDLAKLCAYAMRYQTFRKIVHKQKHSYSYDLPNTKSGRQSKSGKFQNKTGKFEDITDNIQCKSSNLLSKTNKLRQDEKENINPNLVICTNQQRLAIWQNTNRMLGEGWSGIKTGITPNAGPCLAASFSKTIEGRQLQFLVVLLNSRNMEARWQEVRALVNWAIDTKLYL